MSSPLKLFSDIVLANPPCLKAAFPKVYAGTAYFYCHFCARAVQLPMPTGLPLAVLDDVLTG